MTQDYTEVLLVDDSLTVRMDLGEALEADGLRVTPCTSVAEARAALAARRFGLAVLDVMLPDGDGIDLLEEIREAPALADMAVILLSDEAAVRDRIRGLVTGADEYIGKPYDSGYVVARARELLRRGGGQDPSARPTVLVIDDSATFRQRMTEALDGAGYRVLVADTGEAGLRLAAMARPDAVIVDRVLPGMDGVAVLHAIRLDSALRQLPCLLLTGSEAEQDEIAALNAGADAFVRKDEDIAIILARVAAVLRHAAPAGESGGSSLQGPKRILVVDGDEDYLRRVTGELREAGYEVVQTRCGEEAFDLLSAQSVDCILLDLDMPGIGACETCRRIKSVAFSSATPVIVTAAGADRGAVLRGLEAGADDYIGKDGDFAVLRARVQAQIRRRQFEDENRQIREELARREQEAAEARAALEAAGLRERALERCRAQLALAELSLRLARGARWVAMDLTAARLSGEASAALDGIGATLGHARRAARGMTAPEGGHLAELLERADGQAGRAAAAIAEFRAVLAAPLATRVREDINAVIGEIAGLGAAGGWSAEPEVKLALEKALPPVLLNREQLQQVLLVLIRRGFDAAREARRELVIATRRGEAGTVVVTVDGGAGARDPGDVFTPGAAAPENLDLAVCRAVLAAHGGRLLPGAAGLELPAAG